MQLYFTEINRNPIFYFSSEARKIIIREFVEAPLFPLNTLFYFHFVAPPPPPPPLADDKVNYCRLDNNTRLHETYNNNFTNYFQK